MSVSPKGRAQPGLHAQVSEKEESITSSWNVQMILKCEYLAAARAQALHSRAALII